MEDLKNHSEEKETFLSILKLTIIRFLKLVADPGHPGVVLVLVARRHRQLVDVVVGRVEVVWTGQRQTLTNCKSFNYELPTTVLSRKRVFALFSISFPNV